MPELNANSVAPDQTPRSAASDMDLYCLPLTFLWDASGLNGLRKIFVLLNSHNSFFLE